MNVLLVRYFLLLTVIIYEWCVVLSKCPKPCVCEQLTTTCTNVEIVPYVLNPMTKRMELANNRIKQIHDALIHYGRLEYLDLSFNDIHQIEKSTFRKQNLLKILKFNWNMVSSLENDTFLGLNALETLEMKGNAIGVLKANTFSAMKKMKSLDLSHNAIGEIQPLAFNGLNELQTLNLGHNKIKEVPALALGKVAALVKFDMSHNPLPTVPGNAFASLPILQQLFLNDCGLSKLERLSFNGLISLSFLQLDENPFDEIPTEALSVLTSLKVLFIGAGSAIETIQPHAFAGLTQLEELTVHSAPGLKTIEKLALADLTSLWKLSISFNKHLRTLKSGVFDELNFLTHVDLRGNNLQTLDSHQLPWKKLNFFDLRQNSWRCDCSLTWLRTILKGIEEERRQTLPTLSSLHRQSNDLNSNASSVSLTPVGVKCASPPDLHGRYINDLKEDHFDCSLPANVQLAIILVVSFVGLFLVIVIVLVVFGIINREKVSNYFKDSWNQRKRGARNVQYQKTSNEEDIIYRMANGTMKLTPVTEL